MAELLRLRAAPINPAVLERSSDASAMRALLAAPEWDHYLRHVRALEQRQIEQVATDPHDTRYLQGRIQGLRDALALPEVLIQLSRRDHPPATTPRNSA